MRLVCKWSYPFKPRTGNLYIALCFVFRDAPDKCLDTNNRKSSGDVECFFFHLIVRSDKSCEAPVCLFWCWGVANNGRQGVRSKYTVNTGANEWPVWWFFYHFHLHSILLCYNWIQSIIWTCTKETYSLNNCWPYPLPSKHLLHHEFSFVIWIYCKLLSGKWNVPLLFCWVKSW